MNHLSTAHASTKLVAKNTAVETVDDDSRPGVANVSSTNKKPRSCPSIYSWIFLLQLHKNLTQTELNAMIDRYVVENMLLLSTADSDSFRQLTGKNIRENRSRSAMQKYIF